MENQTAPNNPHADLINTFTQITSSSQQEALFFLESHNFDLDAAVSTFFETSTAAGDAAIPIAAERSESLSPESTPSRSRSPSPSPQPPLRPESDRVYNLRSRRQGSDNRASGSRGGRIHTFSDLNKKDGDDSDSDEQPQEYFTGGEKSGMLVQDPSKGNDVDALFDQARQAGGVEGHGDPLQPSSSSRSFSGTARLLTGETITTAPSHPETVTHNITFWTNGFTIDDGPLRRLDDPENASFLESIRKSECPQELAPADVRTVVHVNLMRKEQECPVPKKRPNSFQGQGRTLGSNNDAVPVETTVPSNLQSAPTPSMGLVVDQALPSTSIQLRLADGTRMVSRFNFHHTVRDIRGFIDASRPAAPRSYHLQTVGFPPKQLTNLEQTIEEAGLANSVVIQKL